MDGWIPLDTQRERAREKREEKKVTVGNVCLLFVCVLKGGCVPTQEYICGEEKRDPKPSGNVLTATAYASLFSRSGRERKGRDGGRGRKGS